MTKESTKKPTDGERLNNALESSQFVMTPWRQRNPVEWAQLDRAAAEFAAPYLARIAELEAENKALREAAAPKPYRHNPGPSFGDLCDPDFVASEGDRHNEEEL